MKNIQVRVEESLKDKADEIFEQIGTTTNEAIKIFLKMSVHEEGFPFELKIPRVSTLSEMVEKQMLNITEEEFMGAYMRIDGSFNVDDEFDTSVMNETVTINGFINDDDEEVKLAEAYMKIIDNWEVDAWEAADATSGDYELVASSIKLNTNYLEESHRIAFLDEYFVFSKAVSAQNRVKIFYDYVIPYLQSRGVEVIAFMNAGFWRTDAVEEQRSLDNALRKSSTLSIVDHSNEWNSIVNAIEIS